MLILTDLDMRIARECTLLGVKLSRATRTKIFKDLLGKDASTDDIKAAIVATKSAQKQLSLEKAG